MDAVAQSHPGDHRQEYSRRSPSGAHTDRGFLEGASPEVTMTENRARAERYDYEHEGQREQDDRHARRARDLAEAEIFDEARREAGKIDHYQRSNDLIDEVERGRRRRARTDGGVDAEGITRPDLRPDETECNHRAERALKLCWENPDSRAVRIESDPEPMFVTVEDGALAFWAFDYTWKCQEQVDVADAFGPFETAVDQLHGYANDGYPIGTVSKNQINTNTKPKTTKLKNFT